jgi:hypothetical protein
MLNCQANGGDGGGGYWWDFQNFATSAFGIPYGAGWYPLFQPQPVATCAGQCPDGFLTCGATSVANVGAPSTYHSGGIMVAMGDGSTRLVSQGVSLNTWLYAVTPANGDVLGSDW